jgi:hypothetical protein
MHLVCPSGYFSKDKATSCESAQLYIIQFKYILISYLSVEPVCPNGTYSFVGAGQCEGLCYFKKIKWNYARRRILLSLVCPMGLVSEPGAATCGC